MYVIPCVLVHHGIVEAAPTLGISAVESDSILEQVFCGDSVALQEDRTTYVIASSFMEGFP